MSKLKLDYKRVFLTGFIAGWNYSAGGWNGEFYGTTPIIEVNKLLRKEANRVYQLIIDGMKENK